MKAYADTRKNVGRRPDTAHFEPGTEGWQAETAIWPAEPVRKRPMN